MTNTASLGLSQTQTSSGTSKLSRNIHDGILLWVLNFKQTQFSFGVLILDNIHHQAKVGYPPRCHFSSYRDDPFK